MNNTAVADAFLNTRADHLPSDVFSEFIVPLFFRRISIFSDKKSVRILGGRGCGKTMFIRYFSHSSAFSKYRKQIPEEELQAVGLYFRPDTGFCSLMTPEWLGDQEAKLAFSHYVALQLLAEACQAMYSISNADLSAGPLSLSDFPLGEALSFELGLPEGNAGQLLQIIDTRLAELEQWVRNPKRSVAPSFVSFASVLPRLASSIASISPRMASFGFRAFIDEFENLKPTHREVICDAIKHPNPRLTVHIAHKREAVTDFKTSSDERIVEVHDLRTIDLEQQLSSNGEFPLLAAELFLLRLGKVNISFDCPSFNPNALHDPKYLPQRLSEQYRKDVLSCVRSILPTLSGRQLADLVLSDNALRRRLRDMMEKGLKLHGAAAGFNPDSLINENRPEASVVLGALLNRRSQDVSRLIEQFKVSDPDNKNDSFYKIGGWVDNNLYGCLFHLYAGLPRRPNLLYAGFDRFCQLADPNLRFFQELCHVTLLLALQRKEAETVQGALRVDVEIQATAAKQVSDAVFQDVQQLGQCGDQLLEITRRLGLIFEAFNRRRSQSEPEINHLSIDMADQMELSDLAKSMLREAKIWSVLYEEKDTKNKSDYDVAQTDLILNRIFAPHFNISYRKRRKVTLRASEVDILLCQSAAQFEIILKQLVDPNELDAVGTTTQLF